MLNPNKKKPAPSDAPELSDEERLKVSVRLLKDLKSLKEISDKGECSFLSYLLEMAILETQSIASGAGETVVPHCEVCGTSHDAENS